MKTHILGESKISRRGEVQSFKGIRGKLFSEYQHNQFPHIKLFIPGSNFALLSSQPSNITFYYAPRMADEGLVECLFTEILTTHLQSASVRVFSHSDDLTKLESGERKHLSIQSRDFGSQAPTGYQELRSCTFLVSTCNAFMEYE